MTQFVTPPQSPTPVRNTVCPTAPKAAAAVSRRTDTTDCDPVRLYAGTFIKAARA